MDSVSQTSFPQESPLWNSALCNHHDNILTAYTDISLVFWRAVVLQCRLRVKSWSSEKLISRRSVTSNGRPGPEGQEPPLDLLQQLTHLMSCAGPKCLLFPSKVVLEAQQQNKIQQHSKVNVCYFSTLAPQDFPALTLATATLCST